MLSSIYLGAIAGNAAQNIADLADTIANGRQKVEPLGRHGQRRVVPVASGSATMQLTETVTRVRLLAITADARFKIAPGSPTAESTDNLLLAGTSIDLACLPGSSVAARRNGTTDGSMEIMELID